MYLLPHGHVADTTANPHAAALADILAAGVAAGDFTVTDPQAAAVLLYNTMHGTADYLVEQAGQRELPDSTADAIIAEILNLCRRYVQPHRPE